MVHLGPAALRGIDVVHERGELMTLIIRESSPFPGFRRLKLSQKTIEVKFVLVKVPLTNTTISLYKSHVLPLLVVLCINCLHGILIYRRTNSY